MLHALRSIGPAALTVLTTSLVASGSAAPSRYNRPALTLVTGLISARLSAMRARTAGGTALFGEESDFAQVSLTAAVRWVTVAAMTARVGSLCARLVAITARMCVRLGVFSRGFGPSAGTMAMFASRGVECSFWAISALTARRGEAGVLLRARRPVTALLR